MADAQAKQKARQRGLLAFSAPPAGWRAALLGHAVQGGELP
jgi:hypothetical protein